MSGVSKIYYKDKEILVVDYSSSKEAEMIDIVTQARNIVVSEGNMVRLLSMFDEKNYATPKFMRHVEKELFTLEHRIERHAVTGLTTVKLMILKGLNMMLKNEIRHFNSREEALEFLVLEAES